MEPNFGADLPNPTGFRRGRGLIAFMDESEATSMMRAAQLVSLSIEREFQEKHAIAVKSLRNSEAPNLDASVTPIGPTNQAYLYQVSSTPGFTQAFLGQSWSFCEVEIDKLLCFQKYVDIEYVNELSSGLPSKPDELTLLRYCFPAAAQVPASINVDPVGTAITVTSHLPNIQLANFGLNQPFPGGPTSAVFTFGANVNYVQVVKYEGRYILKNGYHRVYTLRQKGMTATPCVYAEASNFDQTGANRPGFFSRELLLSSRPPVFADFFDTNLSSDVKIQPMLHVLKMRAERFDVPLPVLNSNNASGEVETRS